MMSIELEKKTTERKTVYKKLTQLEHVLLRADMYVGSKEPETSTLFIPEKDESGRTRMVSKTLTYIPAFYKIFDEILVNAADNKVRDGTTDTIKVTIDKENGEISVFNNGKGIPVQIHETEKIYIPEMIFGHLLTSSNFDDDEKKVTGGRNGFGAKLTNIYSLEFHVETHDSTVGKTYKQRWTDNMGKCYPAKISSAAKKSDYTKITFKPDLKRLNMEEISIDAEILLQKRVYDLTGSLRGIKVFLNGERIKMTNFKDYVSMFLGNENKTDDIEVVEDKQKIVYERPNERWEIAVALSDTGTFQHVSFVNSIATTKGGTHVTHVTDKIVAYLVEQVKKKNKDAIVKPAQIKNQIFLFVNCLIENPLFDSQTKENMTLRAAHFGSTCDISESFMKRVVKLGVLEATLDLLKDKDLEKLKKTDGQKRNWVTGILTLSDANNAGTKKSKDCTLFLTEGLSAKSFAMTGIPVVPRGRDIYGAFPLKGKLLNVRDASSKAKLENVEISQLKQILGLKEGKVYTSTDELRYGHICLLVDSDVDGKHIKGLILNWIESAYPSLLKIPGFVLDFKSPIVKCTKGPNDILHYTLREYNEWKVKNNDGKGFQIKYFKGLGTSKEGDIKKYFGAIDKHLKRFRELSSDDSEKLDMAFSKKRAIDRKEWLKKYNGDNYLDDELKIVPIADFIDKDLIEFSMYDNVRSIPSLVDGLKPGQRKILYTAFKTKMTNDVKVAQFAGEVSKLTEYRHGEQSLCETIIGMAQDYVGSNNIALLEPEGAFGTRLQGGHDAASPRYIYTKLKKSSRLLFPIEDDNVLSYLVEDGYSIEPKYYIPIIPMVLVNGAEGIGTGYSTTVLQYNPEKIVEWLMKRTKAINDTDVSILQKEKFAPWYKDFKGSIREIEAGKWMYSGIVEKKDGTNLEITELPIGTWTEKYKEFLEGLRVACLIKEYKEHHTHTSVHFKIKVAPDCMTKLTSLTNSGNVGSTGQDEDIPLVTETDALLKNLKLTTTKNSTNMMLFSSTGSLTKYESPVQILEEFYGVRIECYKKRKEYLLRDISSLLKWAGNKVRFIRAIVDGTLSINNKKKTELETILRKEKYDAGGEGDSGKNDYSYLLNMALHSLTSEKILELSIEEEKLKKRYDEIFCRSAEEMYRFDLTALDLQQTTTKTKT